MESRLSLQEYLIIKHILDIWRMVNHIIITILSKRRVNNYDSSTYMCVKADF